MYTDCFSLIYKPKMTPKDETNYAINKFRDRFNRAVEAIIKKKPDDKKMLEMLDLIEIDGLLYNILASNEIIIENNDDQIKSYKNEISKLEEKLDEAKKLNNILSMKFNGECQKERILKNKELLMRDIEKSYENKINKLNQLIIMQGLYKANEEKEGYQIISNNINKIKNDKNENNLYVKFVSSDFGVNYLIPCNKDDLVSRLEEELCKLFKKYKEYNITLTLNGKSIKRFKTIEENGIKSGDLIQFSISE